MEYWWSRLNDVTGLLYFTVHKIGYSKIWQESSINGMIIIGDWLRIVTD